MQADILIHAYTQQTRHCSRKLKFMNKEPLESVL